MTQSADPPTRPLARIAVITNGGYGARVILDDLFQSDDVLVDRIVIVTGDYAGRSKLGALFAVGRVTAFPYTVFKVVVFAYFTLLGVFRKGFVQDVAALARKHRPDAQILVSRLAETEETMAFVRSGDADVVLSSSCPQKLSPDFLSIGRQGTVNLHGSLLPKFAGLAPYFWVLAQGESVTGMSIHFATESFDAGALLGQTTVQIKPGQSAFSLFDELNSSASATVCQAVLAAASGDDGTAQDLTERSYFSHPSMAAWRAMRRNGHRLARFSDFAAAFRDASSA